MSAMDKIKKNEVSNRLIFTLIVTLRGHFFCTCPAALLEKNVVVYEMSILPTNCQLISLQICVTKSTFSLKIG